MTHPRSLPSRLLSSAASFCRAEDGSATVWNLTWLAGFAIMGGVAIDSTNAWRHKTMLASTADVAALAGAWDLPKDYEEVAFATGDYSDVDNSALNFAAMNMDPALHGGYMQTGDINVGHWEKSTRSFYEGSDPVNAVRVEAFQNEDRGNVVQTTLLRFIGIFFWQNIDAEAVAMLGIDECYLNGVITREKLFVRSNAKIYGDVCLHGQLGVNIRPNAEWVNPDTLTAGDSPSDIVGDWDIGSNQYVLNADGTRGDVLDMSEPNYYDRYPPMVDQITEIGYSMLAGFKDYRHFSYPAQEQNVPLPDPPNVVVLDNNFAEITGTTKPASADAGTGATDQTWWRTEESVQVASLDGFSSLAMLLGTSQTATATTMEYHDTYTYAEVDRRGGSDNFDWEYDKNAKISMTSDMNTVSGPSGTSLNLTEETIYFVNKCQSGILQLSGEIRNITVVTNCKIDIANNAVVENAVLLTTATGSQAVQISNGTRIGAKTTCEGWGGVMILSNGDIRATGNGDGTPPTQDDETAGISQYWGAYLVARDDIHFAAKSDSEKGITMFAGGSIDIAAQAELGALQLPVDEADEEAVEDCGKGVGKVFDQFAYTVALVH